MSALWANFSVMPILFGIFFGFLGLLLALGFNLLRFLLEFGDWRFISAVRAGEFHASILAGTKQSGKVIGNGLLTVA